MAAAISIMISQTGCFGGFELTKKVWEFNDNTFENKFLKTLFFYVLNIVPVYGIAGFLDVVIFNLIEFWSGSNPIAMEEGLRFAIREGGRTVGAGVVAKIIE